MPRLTPLKQAPTSNIQFVVSPSLDMMNAMYFTSLVPQTEGVEGWPLQLRTEMRPELLAELDFLYNYPAGDPGLMGTLGENLFTRPETWQGVDALLRYVRSMPDGIGGLPLDPGIQGITYQATFRYPEDVDPSEYEGMSEREAIERRMRSLGDRDADAIMAQYDRPAELRERMAGLIQRFYQEHYREEMAGRVPCLERSAAEHRAEEATLLLRFGTQQDAARLAARLTGRERSCLEGGCAGPFERYVFAPSLDMGAYTSCAVVDGTHGLFYPCERRFVTGGDEEEDTVRLARIHRALSDEQRLRILRLLQEREMYAQEIVERTGLHQSVVSRHLGFMKVVGLVRVRPQNNMKFFSLNPDIQEELNKTISLFARTEQV